MQGKEKSLSDYEGKVLLIVNTASEDRKSTRLNSSHVAISYAVFCLKKKKIVEEQATSLASVDSRSNSVHDHQIVLIHPKDTVGANLRVRPPLEPEPCCDRTEHRRMC